jgi:hypothetical protein
MIKDLAALSYPPFNPAHLLNTDTYDKAQLVCDLVESLGKCDSFHFRETSMVRFTELFIMDEDVAVLMFQLPGGYDTIADAIIFRDPQVISKFKEVFLRIWDSPDTYPIKESRLTDEEIHTAFLTLVRYKNQAKNLAA